jgi:DNA mismatch repair protein MutS2
MKLAGLDWLALTQNLANHAHSARAKDACLQLSIASSAKEAKLSVENILQGQTLLELGSLRLSIIDAILPILERLEKQAVLDVKELSHVREFLSISAAQKDQLREGKNAWCTLLFSKIADFKSQLGAIDHVLSATGEINEHASQTLQSLCDERRKLSREVARTLDQIVKRNQLENILQDRYVTNREGRLVIPVKSGNQHDIKGLIHDASQTKQTVFMEPEEVIPINNRLRELQNLIQEEIYRILKELSQYLVRSIVTFKNADLALLECDTVFAKSLMAKKMAACDFKFSYAAPREIKLFNLKHPLLLLQGVDVVPNTVILKKEKRILLLSGPNAGGKTILLKALGLASQMARCGLPIPADEHSEIPFFEHIDPIVGDLQSVGENLSSFSSHIARLNESLKYKGPETLVLVDEICGSTDPEEGAALARSFIESFDDQEIFAIVTSHLGPLKENWSSSTRVEHGSLEFDSKSNKPTYQLLMGFPGRSLALSVATRLGVPDFIIGRAKSFLSPDSQSRSKDLTEIEYVKDQLQELKKQAQVDCDEAKNKKQEYLELVKKFREQRDRWLEKALEKAQKKIENLIEDARLDRLKNKTLQDIKAELPQIIKAKPSAAIKIQTLDEFKIFFKPGTPAFSARLGRQVLVQSEPDGRGQVLVQADSMRLQVPWHHLQPINSAAKSQASGANDFQTVQRRNSLSKAATSNTFSSDDATNESIDLRGRRPDEALELLEKFLDSAMLDKKDRIKIIHGFGTEVLKKAIRQFLSKSRYVAKWKGGDSTTGGDGVTWAELAD